MIFDKLICDDKNCNGALNLDGTCLDCGLDCGEVDPFEVGAAMYAKCGKCGTCDYCLSVRREIKAIRDEERLKSRGWK